MNGTPWTPPPDDTAARDADPISHHNELMRQIGHADYFGRFDRPQRSPLVRRSGPEGLVYRTTERAAPAPQPAPQALLDVVEDDDPLAAVAGDVGLTVAAVDMIAGAIGLSESAQDDKRNRALKRLRKRITALERRLAELEQTNSKSAVVDLPAFPLKHRRVA
jgi:hypothetical protein